MYVHISNITSGQNWAITVSYDDLQPCSPDLEHQVFDAFFDTLTEFRIVRVVKEKDDDMIKCVWCYVPFLVSQKPDETDIDKHIWNINIDDKGTMMELGLLFTFDTLLSKSTFSSCCSLKIICFH